MELTIYRCGIEVGSLFVQADGLYRVLRARIRPTRELLRLYLSGKSIGVLCPEGNAMTLCRRVSRAELPTLPEYAIAWCPSDGKWAANGAGLIRHTPQGPERAIPWRTDGPMEFPEAPGCLHPMELEGRYYLYLPISR